MGGKINAYLDCGMYFFIWLTLTCLANTRTISVSLRILCIFASAQESRLAGISWSRHRVRLCPLIYRFNGEESNVLLSALRLTS